MQLGKYEVVATVTGSHEGGFQAGVTRSWMEGGKRLEVHLTLDRIFGTMGEARDHAYEHARIEVDAGNW